MNLTPHQPEAVDASAVDTSAAPGPGATWTTVRAVWHASTAPLVRRAQVGEGMLIPINVSLSLAAGHGVLRSCAETVLSVGALAAMYEVNDLLDARQDLDNPRKDRTLALLMIGRRGLLAPLLVAQHLALVVATATLLGVAPAAMMAAVLTLNLTYSVLLKGVPGVDVLAVGLWGGTFAAIVGSGWAAVAVGAMTAISHVFQALGDREPDLRAGLRTVAASSWATPAVLLAASIALVFALQPLVPAPYAWAGLAPLAIGLLVRRATLAWRLSKIAFAVVWMVVVDGLARGR